MSTDPAEAIRRELDSPLIDDKGNVKPNFHLFPEYGTSHFILNDQGEPVPEHNVLAWARWFSTDPKRHVSFHDLGRVQISTVFMGLNHGWLQNSRIPVLWETMIFGGKFDQYQTRYTSKTWAEQGHKKALEMVLTQTRKSRSHAFKVLWKKYLKRYGA